MTDNHHFAGNLRLAMSRLNLSGVELAWRLGVDGSVVRRWLSGSAKPKAANLTALTDLVARDVEGFTRDHWSDTPDANRVRLGLAPAARQDSGMTRLLPFFGARADAARMIGHDRFSGLWAQFYAPIAPEGHRPVFCGAVRIDLKEGHLWYHVSDGPRGVWTGGGPAFAVDGKLWTLIEEVRGRSDMAAIVYNGTSGHKAEILDGLALARAANAGGVPVTGRFTLFRIADLPDDPELAEARYVALAERAGALSLNDLASQLPDWVRELLLGAEGTWAGRHQAFVLALSAQDDLTTDAIDIDLTKAAGRPRRVLLETIRALFA